MAKRPCPYEGCGCRDVWYWGWYEREEGCIPFGDEGESVAGRIPIRRFRCPACERTFSWRPRFLLFGRRFAALYYQRAFRDWAQGRPPRASGAWCEPERSGWRAFWRFLTQRRHELLRRLKEEASWPASASTRTPEPEERRRVWEVARRRVRALAGPPERRPPLSIHLVCVALAPHPHDARYALTSC